MSPGSMDGWDHLGLPRLGRRTRAFGARAPADPAASRLDLASPGGRVVDASPVDLALASHVETILLDVAVDRIERLEEAIRRLARVAAVEVVKIVVVDPHGEAAISSMAHVRGLKRPQPGGRLARVVDAPAEGPREAIGGPFQGEPERAALFGVDSWSRTLGDEVLAEAHDVPDTHAAVLVVLHHAWRDILASLLTDNNTEVLIDRWIEGPDIERHAQIGVPLEALLDEESRTE